MHGISTKNPPSLRVTTYLTGRDKKIHPPVHTGPSPSVWLWPLSWAADLLGAVSRAHAASGELSLANTKIFMSKNSPKCKIFCWRRGYFVNNRKHLQVRLTPTIFIPDKSISIYGQRAITLWNWSVTSLVITSVTTWTMFRVDVPTSSKTFSALAVTVEGPEPRYCAIKL